MQSQFTIVGVGQNSIALESPDFPASVVKVPFNGRMLSEGLTGLWREARTSYAQAKSKGARHPIVFAVRCTAFNLNARYAIERHHAVVELLRLASALPKVRQTFASFELSDVNIERVSHYKYRYRGTAVVQEKLSPIDIDNTTQEHIDSFVGSGVSELHHELWSYGLGLAASQETWSPINWGENETGQFRLMDFSSLTSDRSRVERAIDNETRVDVMSLLRNRWPNLDLRRIEDELATNLNADKLASIWNSRGHLLSSTVV